MKTVTAIVCIIGIVMVIDTNQIEAKEIQRIDQKIDWAAADKAKQDDAAHDTGGIKQFRSAKVPSEVLNQTRLPILVLGTGPVRAAPKVYTQKEAYASTYRIGSDSKLTILGSRSAITLDEQLAIDQKLEVDSSLPYTIDFLEDGIDLNFSKFGASYTLRITCSTPSDKRCTDKKFIVDSYDSLITVGGSEK
jgi:hypothetical protein